MHWTKLKKEAENIFKENVTINATLNETYTLQQRKRTKNDQSTVPIFQPLSFKFHPSALLQGKEKSLCAGKSAKHNEFFFSLLHASY